MLLFSLSCNRNFCFSAKTYSVSDGGEIHISAEVQIYVPVNTLDIVTSAYYFSQAVLQSGKMFLIRYNSKFNCNNVTMYMLVFIRAVLQKLETSTGAIAKGECF
jgi:hypothetical protein